MYIVTGGAGFIGSNIVELLLNKGKKVVVCEPLQSLGNEKFQNIPSGISDLIDSNDLCRYVSNNAYKIDGISHQGGCVDTREYDCDFMMRENFFFTRDLVNVCNSKQVRLVYASSAAVYGNSSTCKESPEFERPNNIYGFSKLMIDNYVRSLPKNPNGALIVGLRYFNVYGNPESHKGSMRSMVHQIYEQALEGSVRLFGGTPGFAQGEHKRDFIHVHDVAEINWRVLAGQNIREVMNVGTGVARSFNEVTRSVERWLETDVPVTYFPMPEDLVERYQGYTRSDNSRLLGEIGPYDFIQIEQGVQTIIP